MSKFLFELEIPPQECAYVYRLLDANDKILYIGQTKNLFFRIGVHLKENVIPFFKCLYEICDPENSINLETEEILTHWPPYNRSISPNPYWFSFNSYRRINPIIKGNAIAVRRLMKRMQILDRHGYVHIEDWEKICNALRDGGVK